MNPRILYSWFWMQNPVKRHLFVNETRPKINTLFKPWNKSAPSLSLHLQSGKLLVNLRPSPCGEYLAFGSADLSISILSSSNLIKLKHFQNIHGFPVTVLVFSHDSKQIASGSADGSVSILQTPEQSQPRSSCCSLLFFSLLTLILLSFILINLPDQQEL